MDNPFKKFESISRSAYQYSVYPTEVNIDEHSFEERRIHPALPENVRQLFDNAHYAQATFEAFKFIDKEVARLSGQSESGKKLMMTVFSETKPLIKLNGLASISEIDEQEGYKFLFAGAITAIRNPRGHEYSIRDTVDECLDHLSLASVLLRRIEAAGFQLTAKK